MDLSTGGGNHSSAQPLPPPLQNDNIMFGWDGNLLLHVLKWTVVLSNGDVESNMAIIRNLPCHPPPPPVDNELSSMAINKSRIK